MTMTDIGFMHKFYDWGAFETFIKNMYEGDGDVTVERDITDIDRYGAKRQTDIKISRRTRFHKIITLVECKRWKQPVSRDRIDVLASSIEALGANNGAIFTTTGFEQGAISYAKGKGIDLFVVRDLTQEEWGLPGRHVSFLIHFCAAEFRDIHCQASAFMLVDGEFPNNVDIGIELSKNKSTDPNYDLFSVVTGEICSNLVKLLGDAHGIILTAISNSIGTFGNGTESTLEIKAKCEIDFTATEFKQLRFKTFVMRLERIHFTCVSKITETVFEFDRGTKYDFAVMIESYVNDQRLIAHKNFDDEKIVIKDYDTTHNDATPPEEPLRNGSILKVCYAPWIALDKTTPTRKGVATNILQILVETKDGQPSLSLRSRPIC